MVMSRLKKTDLEACALRLRERGGEGGESLLSPGVGRWWAFSRSAGDTGVQGLVVLYVDCFHFPFPFLLLSSVFST